MKYFIIIILFAAVIGFMAYNAFNVETEGVVINPKFKPYIQKVTDKVKNFIYDEAIKHNPEGDMLPDGVDDRVKQEIKERLH